MSNKRDWYKCVNSNGKGVCEEQGWVYPGNTPTRNNSVKKYCPYSSDGHHDWRKIPGHQNITTDLNMYPEEEWNIEK